MLGKHKFGPSRSWIVLQSRREIGVFGCAFLRAFTKDTILVAFEATGICPFNPDIITGD
jgi:hypothetical protein